MSSHYRENWQFKPITPFDIHRRRRSRWRQWVVLCYALKPGYSNPYRNGERHWKLLDIKQFATLKDLEASASFNRTYYPYNNEQHLVVSGRAKTFQVQIVEYCLDDPME